MTLRHVLIRLVLIALGLNFALPAGLLAFAIVIGPLLGLTGASGDPLLMLMNTLLIAAVSTKFVEAWSLLPVLGVIALAELFAYRSWVYHVSAGALAAVCSGLLTNKSPGSEMLGLVIAGMASGFVYWLIAGRRSGIRRTGLTPPTYGATVWPEPDDTPDADGSVR